MTTANVSRGAILTALGCNLALAAAAFAAEAQAGGSVLLALAIQAMVAAWCQALLVFSGDGPASATGQQQTGGARDRAFWAYVVALLLYAVAAGVILRDGISKFLLATPPAKPEIDLAMLYAVQGVALLLGTGTTVMAIRAGRVTHGAAPLFRAVRRAGEPALLSLMIQGFASMAVAAVALAGTAGTLHLGVAWADGAATTSIGIAAAIVAILFALETKRALAAVASTASAAPTVTAVPAATAAVAVAKAPALATSGRASSPRSIAATATMLTDGPAIPMAEPAPPAPVAKPAITARPPSARKGAGGRKGGKRRK